MTKPFWLVSRGALVGAAVLALATPAAFAEPATDSPATTSTPSAPAKPTDAPKPTDTSNPTGTPKPTDSTKPTESGKPKETGTPEPSKPGVEPDKAAGAVFLGDLDAGDAITSTVRKGGNYRIAAYCSAGKPTGFSSPVLTFGSLTADKDIWLAKATVRTDASPGRYAITGKCGDQTLSWSISVVEGAAKVKHGKTVAAQQAKAKKPQAAIKPKGKIETGGGALVLG
ncbi:hypothetical protein [Amycolatopsis nigrescens]|uniref:hypothetical protein n=1 Tax=Amycolatopsis nigrescens TaxID=381445 RepID=UPI00036EA145|nr:hypothetical protein [Amycolatopsis nigrescens]